MEMAQSSLNRIAGSVEKQAKPPGSDDYCQYKTVYGRDELWGLGFIYHILAIKLTCRQGCDTLGIRSRFVSG